MLHKIRKKNCLNNSYWDEYGVLRCRKCGEVIAICFKIGDKVDIGVYLEFKKFRQLIQLPEDEEVDYAADISFKEFDEILEDIKQDQAKYMSDLGSIGISENDSEDYEEDNEGTQEDSENLDT